MKVAADTELPESKVSAYHKAKRLEWITVAYLVSVVILMYLVLGSSQAMRAAWFEDLFSLIPPIVVLIGFRVRNWPANWQFPYGYHRVMDLAYMVASFALLAMGVYLFIDSIMGLVSGEHPTLGTFTIYGLLDQPVWIGWVMLPVLVYSGLPAVILGTLKQGPGRELHDKPLFADAAMNRADWMTAAAAVVGVVLVGFGYWWGDSVAAAIIAVDVAKDGAENVWASGKDLMDRTPFTVDNKQAEDLPGRLTKALKELSWVRDAQVRLRDAGQVFFGEAYIVPNDGDQATTRVREALAVAHREDWRINDLAIHLTADLEDFQADDGGPNGAG